jgi:hypothetical protein
MQAPPLSPPPHAPFSVDYGDNVILITLHAGAGQHPGLSQRQASRWIQRAAVPVAVDLSRIALLNSRIVGWLFGLILDGPLTVLDIRNANRHVHAQIRRIGLAAFVAATPASVPAAGQRIGQQLGREAEPALKDAAAQPVTG